VKKDLESRANARIPGETLISFPGIRWPDG